MTSSYCILQIICEIDSERNTVAASTTQCQALLTHPLEWGTAVSAADIHQWGRYNTSTTMLFFVNASNETQWSLLHIWFLKTFVQKCACRIPCYCWYHFWFIYMYTCRCSPDWCPTILWDDDEFLLWENKSPSVCGTGNGGLKLPSVLQDRDVSGWKVRNVFLKTAESVLCAN